MAHFKACSRCGKIHDVNYQCNVNRYTGGKERKLRSSRKWTNKSKEIRQTALFCEVCKDKGIYVYKNLEVHHIIKVRDDEDKLLDNYNLICLCPDCHEKAERGKLDAEYLLKLAKQREDAT